MARRVTCSNLVIMTQFVVSDGVDHNVGTLDDNLQLLPTSPAIDTGITEVVFQPDILGVTRPQGVACDMGAYEFSQCLVYATRTYSYIYSNARLIFQPLHQPLHQLTR